MKPAELKEVMLAPGTTSSRKALLAIAVAGLLLTACEERPSPPAPDGDVLPSSRLEEAEGGGSSVENEPAAQHGSPAQTDQGAAEKQQLESRRLTLELTGRDLTSGKTSLDSEGNPVKAVFADGAKIIFEASRPIAFITSQGEKTVYEYDSRGSLLQVIYPDGHREHPDVRIVE